MEPNSARYHNSLGDTLYNLEQYEKAIELEPEEASYYSDISIIFRELGRYDDAMDTILKAIRLQPEMAWYHYEMGEIFQDMGMNQEALEKFEMAIELEPDEAWYYLLQAKILANLERYDDAIAECEKGIKVQPEKTDVLRRDSECLSICLYPQVYKVENLMRELINEVMTKQYGISWWDSYAPANIKKKHSDRLKEYKSKVPSFNDVDERLMSIDIDDLGVLVQHKRYKWNPVYDERINNLLNGTKSYNDGIVREELLKQRVIETDLWVEQFSRYLPEDFNDRYAVFTRDRNHIMHNKLLDRGAFRTIKESIEQIEEDLVAENYFL